MLNTSEKGEESIEGVIIGCVSDGSSPQRSYEDSGGACVW